MNPKWKWGDEKPTPPKEDKEGDLVSTLGEEGMRKVVTHAKRFHGATHDDVLRALGGTTLYMQINYLDKGLPIPNTREGLVEALKDLIDAVSKAKETEGKPERRM